MFNYLANGNSHLWLLAQSTSTKTPLPSPGLGVIATLIVFIIASVWLGAMAERAVRNSSFVKGFFLGNRGLGAWALALTATVQSGGTFMGVPSLVYSHGWVVALWIGSYMVVPITGFGIVGKRVAQISRKTGAITMPDLFRERFDSPALGLITSLFVILFLSATMVAQFKAGATVMKLAFPHSGFLSLSEDAATSFDAPYMAGLLIFAATVVGYTLIGGFLAAVWTDLFQSVLMFVGVLLLLGLSLSAVGGLTAATKGAAAGAQVTADAHASLSLRERAGLRENRKTTQPLPHPSPLPGGEGTVVAGAPLANGSDTAPWANGEAAGRYVTGPGFTTDGREFLPLSLAISFFVLWPAAGFASPASVTRVMACKSTRTLRHSIGLLCLYNLGIYLPLICICMCARTLMPNLEKPDEVVPRMALMMTDGIPGGQIISGLILAAPFGAIMASVSTYLVVIAAGLVRDLYQRFVAPDASENTLRWLSRGSMIAIGVLAVGLNIYPVKYLQALVVFASGGVGASFIVPSLMLCYWRRATAAGAITAMLVGGIVLLGLYIAGPFVPDPMMGAETKFRPYFPLGMEPLIAALVASAVAGVAVSLGTAPPREELVSKLFDAEAEPSV